MPSPTSASATVPKPLLLVQDNPGSAHATEQRKTIALHAVVVYLKYLDTNAPCDQNVPIRLKRSLHTLFDEFAAEFDLVDRARLSDPARIGANPLCYLTGGKTVNELPGSFASAASVSRYTLFDECQRHLFQMLALDTLSKFVVTEPFIKWWDENGEGLSVGDGRPLALKKRRGSSLSDIEASVKQLDSLSLENRSARSRRSKDF
ncbi:hypothetical protein SeLEV6574_g07942 [Synchytrium endobioticum]|nr:hypothetical protein SeLEV6574_g07942 [Synchytrium endobioticum]